MLDWLCRSANNNCLLYKKCLLYENVPANMYICLNHDVVCWTGCVEVKEHSVRRADRLLVPLHFKHTHTRV